jgi:hypothetical protein
MHIMLPEAGELQATDLPAAVAAAPVTTVMLVMIEAL